MEASGSRRARSPVPARACMRAWGRAGLGAWAAGWLGVISETISVAVSSFLHHFLNYGIHVQVHGWKIAAFIFFYDLKAIFFIEAYCLFL